MTEVGWAARLGTKGQRRVRRRLVAITLATGALALGGISPQWTTTATSAPRTDPRTEREQVRAERAQVAAQLDTSQASVADVDKAVAAIDDNLDTQQAALDRVQAEVAQAERDMATARRAIAKLSSQVHLLRGEMRRRAVRAYVSPPDDDVLTVLDSKDFTSASARKFFIQLRADDDADVADRLDGARTDLAYQRRLATQARARARHKEAEQAKRTDAVRKARDQKQALADKLQATVDSQLQRSIDLAGKDRQLSAQIAEQQARLVARLAQVRAQQRAAAKAVKVRNEGSSSVGANGKEHAPSAPSNPPADTSIEPGPTDDGITIAYVQGVPTNARIADKLKAMLDAAAADGTPLSINNSYRSVAEQIRLREQNCGTSQYAIYQMSSGSCHPPTAIPGGSQHQVGLAIDFNGCRSHGTACWGWLNQHAAAYGFYNLPSEAWHWSTTGR